MDNMLLPISSSELIASSHDAVDAIKTAAGLTDAQFTALCMPVLRAYADHVQRLPLTSSAFASPRGAWEFGLTAAMVAYRYAGTVIFYPALGAEERRMLEPQCRYMAFLATLSTAVATVAEASSLSAGDDEYHPLSVEGTFVSWLAEHPGAKFTWRTSAAPLSAQACAAIAANFVPKRLLANFDLRAVLMMYEAINPKTTMNGVESTMARVVRQAAQGVLDHYRAKQAGTFIPEANVASVSPVDAEKVAGKMIAAANPTILANPLEMMAPASAGQAQTTAPANATQDASTAPAATDATHSASPTPAASPAAVAAPPQSDSPQSAIGAMNDGEEKLARANKVLREWFSALKQHQQFHVLKDQLVMNSDGIEVPVSMLGMFGVSGASIRKMMDDAELIIGRSSNARGVILHPGLRERFISQ
ncbi:MULTISPECIES: TraI domain-containing protein [Massilia]|uniref:TraI domain-containing protein n=1 Tax=Massilia TaxID=149698 RepID=UPI0009E00E85|nr:MULTISPECIES: TraI domain-containing protein [Massilia]